MRKKSYLIAAAMVLGLNLVGCSGGAADSAATQTTAAEAETEETKAEQAETEADKEESSAGEKTETAENEDGAESKEDGGDGQADEGGKESEAAAETPEETPEETPAETAAEVKHSGFLFQSGGVTMGMNENVAPILSGLGDYINYAESPSCAFKGLDKIYSYNGFDLYTYPKDGVDYVNSIYFLDASVSTPEGIHIGSSVDEMLAAYGDDYAEEYGVYTYANEKSTLSFIVTDGVIESVEYVAITE